MKQRRIVVLVLVTAFLLAVMGRLSATPQPIDLAAAVNYQHYLATGNWLAGDHALDIYAQNVAERLARSGLLVHSDITILLGCQWRVVGENIGVGPDIAAIMAGWLASPIHKANITGGYSHLGVGLVARDGRLWVVTVFAQ